MPHCIIEYSNSLETRIKNDVLINAVHQGIIHSHLFELSHVRIRATGFESFISGYDCDDFVHVTLKILSGRSQEQKKQLTELVLKELEQLGLISASLSVEVIDIDKASYSRKIV